MNVRRVTFAFLVLSFAAVSAQQTEQARPQRPIVGRSVVATTFDVET